MATDLALIEEDVRALLVEFDGNVTKAASKLGVESKRLRAYVYAKPGLKEEMAEINERGVDEALEVVFAALRDHASVLNRFYAAKVILGSEAGRRRGYGREVPAQTLLVEGRKEPGGQAITLRWLDEKGDEKRDDLDG